MKKRIAFLFLVSIVISNIRAQEAVRQAPPFYMQDTRWADSVFKTLTKEQRIAQLFMVAAYSNKDKNHIKEIKKLVDDYYIGGLIFFQGGPVRQAILANCYQSCVNVPLFMSMDAEWGLGMRLDSTMKFPRQMTLGAIQNDSLIYEMGVEIARQCKRLGMQINFAPDIDINNNPLNPVIGNRSFGEDKYNVTRKALMYMKGMQDNHVLANGKHFPGHGDTDSDSHKTLPTIKSSRERLDTLELYPFKELMKQGLGSIMVAHLSIPALDTTPNQPSTLTRKIVTGLLKDTLDFKGLVFTDALNMKGVSKFYKPGEISAKALIAGNDVLLFPEDVPQGIAEIKAAMERGEITQEDIDKRCMKILLAKQWAGLNRYSKIKLENLIEDLNTPQADLINRKLTEASLTLLQNKNNILPLQHLDSLKIASLSLGYKELNVFQKTLSNYAPVKHYGIDKEARQLVFDTVLAALKNYNLVLVQINNTNNKPDKNFGLTPEVMNMLKALMKQTTVVLTIAANPYILAKMDSVELADAIIMSYEDTDLSASYSAQLIFGGIGAKGKLPVSPTERFKLGTGIETTPIRFKYTIPEELGIDSKLLSKIDSIALKGVQDKVYPGCQIVVAKDEKIIYQKSFGYHTYENKIQVKNSDLYDIASITKIVSSTASVMRLMDMGKLSLDNRLSDYLPELNGTNKQDVLIREMLTHQAGFRDWIAFWTKTVNKDGSYKPGIYSRTPNEQYLKRVADDLYISNNYEDTIYKQIIESPIKDRGKYLYSDLGYYFLKKIIEKQSESALNVFTLHSFYAPMGLATMGYKPLSRFEMNEIVPTEFDAKFRKQLLHGDVHDPGAAMLGGVAGHAGIFSNANDVAVMMQLFLNKGKYGGVRYIDSVTISQCTQCQYKDNRRGIGFDKPETNPVKESPVCTCVSDESFGHTGFTGTLAWADPRNQSVYVFLSNRVYPNADENKLAKSGIRTKIQEIIYQALK